MGRTAVQLYTLRKLDETIPTLLRRVGETTFDGVEFAGFGETSPQTAADVLDDVGLDAASLHIGMNVLEEAIDDVRETCTALGCERVVVPHLDGDFESPAGVREAATRLSEQSDRVRDRGLTLGYHNHEHEFSPLPSDGRSGYELLIDETDEALFFELDVGWAVAAGHDPVGLLERLGGRAPLVHVKDVADGNSVELGDGTVDVDACTSAARDAGAEWLIYEHDNPDAPAASLARGARRLAQIGGG